MSKRIEQITIGCAINVAIINDVNSTKDFRHACINTPLKYNIKPPCDGEAFPFMNASWEVYKLYCMIVVPKELYKLTKDDDFFISLNRKNIMRNFEMIKSRYTFEKSPEYHFNSMRNSISHVNYDFDENGDYIMWDHSVGKSQEKDWHWHVKVTRNDISIFLGELNEEIFKLYNEVNSGLRSKETYKKG